MTNAKFEKEVEGLTIGDVINTMKIGQYAVVLNENKAKLADKSLIGIQPPMGVCWDEEDSNILKHILPHGTLVDLHIVATTDGFTSRFKILENKEAYFNYVSEYIEKNMIEGD